MKFCSYRELDLGCLSENVEINNLFISQSIHQSFITSTNSAWSGKARVQIKEKKFKLRKIESGTETVPSYNSFSPEAVQKIFPDIPIYILTFMKNMFMECEAMPDLKTRISHFSIFPTVLHSEIKRLPGYRNVMANCSFNLGFRIKRDALCRAINDMNDPLWSAHFNNSVDYSVKIEMVCDKAELEKNNVLVSKKNAVPVCTFVVYTSSYVMMSSKLKIYIINCVIKSFQ